MSNPELYLVLLKWIGFLFGWSLMLLIIAIKWEIKILKEMLEKRNNSNEEVNTNE